MNISGPIYGNSFLLLITYILYSRRACGQCMWSLLPQQPGKALLSELTSNTTRMQSNSSITCRPMLVRRPRQLILSFYSLTCNERHYRQLQCTRITPRPLRCRTRVVSITEDI
ncbi:hypothetical protein BKA64DRAFT_288426 [Cadophora sp. MPI-SDFR-AT-0126]|nr:hypothetical protein BKA64DRAFT_288426 [Leotiomycetes sp. MPI-SDFR-AT-0126]